MLHSLSRVTCRRQRNFKRNLFYFEIMLKCLFYLSLLVLYLDCGVERHPVLLQEAGPDVQHVQLAPRHHYPHQGAVIGPSALE